MSLGFKENIVMTFGCKKQKSQLIIVKTKKAYWLATKKFLENLLQSQLDQGAKALLCHWDLVSTSQPCLLLCWLDFQAGFMLVVARWRPAISGSHPYSFRSSGKETVLLSSSLICLNLKIDLGFILLRSYYYPWNYTCGQRAAILLFG